MTEAQPSQQPVIEVNNLVTHYGDLNVLKDVSLTIQQGEIMVIMGGSGSGKSTLLRHLIALERATSGSIKLLGSELSELNQMELYELCRKIGVSFQGGALFSSMTVMENIILPLREHQDLNQMTMEIMARMKLQVVDLAKFENLMPSQLSGGMIKRAAIARAIIMDPALLFLDEPSAGLDPVVSSALDKLILELREAMQMTIVVVTHELESAFTIADRITVLDKGKILTVGSVNEVRNSSNERIQDLLNRRFEEEELDPEEYLRRLTGQPEDSDK